MLADSTERHGTSAMSTDDDGNLPKLAYSVPEFQKATGLGRTRLYEEIRLGRLRLTKVGRRSIIAVDDARAWLDGHRAGPAKPAL
jgi:hypothetical protein